MGLRVCVCVCPHQVPSGLRGQAHLKVWGNRHLTEGGYIFHNYTTVTVESKGTAVFIQTDKPVYKPKDKGSAVVHSEVNQTVAAETLKASVEVSKAVKTSR